MPRIRFTFGLDFGTSKTALCFAQTGTVNPPIVDMATNSKGDPTQTCILRNTANDKIYVGRPAEQEYIKVQNDELRRMLEFHSNFKPHIHQSAEHRKRALQFLTAVRQSEPIDREIRRKAGESVVAAGCPVSWIRNGSADTLRSLLEEAGFPPVFTVAEPVGAAFYFLAAHLKAEDFHRDIVVFDWGAGTFDMTVLRAGRIDLEGSRTWGSTIYGGRLFDDLFYQWLLESATKGGRQAEVAKLASRPVDRAILLSLRCRELKEEYSNHSRESGRGQWSSLSSVEIGLRDNKISLGDFIVSSADEFESRMRAYVPTAEAREWVNMSTGDIQPQEREFVDRLRRGESVDLEAWGRRLIDAGLDDLKVAPDATAILTGGSCNWQWFFDYVRSRPLFAGRENKVLRDSKPELTIARGLARAYAVGSYSKELVAEIESKRAQLVAPMTEIHGRLVKKLALDLTALMRADEMLKAELREIFRDGLNRLEPPPTALKEQGTRLIDAIVRDRGADAVRPDLEKRIQRWLLDERKKAERWAERFSIEAHALIMELLKQKINPDIAALAEIATQVCGATGETTFEEALRKVGSEVHFDTHMFLRISEALMGILPTPVKGMLDSLFGKKALSAGGGPLDAQIEVLVGRFFAKMPDAIEANILAVQSAELWAQSVIDHLVATLQTLVRIARVDHAEELTMKMA